MDIETIIYLVFLGIFLLFRLLKGAQKLQGKGQPLPWETQQTPETRENDRPKQEAGSPEEIPIPEIFKQFEKPKKKTEIKQKAYKPQKVFKKPQPAMMMEGLDKIEAEEGVSAIDKAIKANYTPGFEIIEEEVFQFDPREAFRMKILLERRGRGFIR